MERSELQNNFQHLDKRDREVLISLAPPKLLDKKDAQLKLDFLKENFDYLDFFEKFKNDPKDYLAISKIPEKDYSSKKRSLPLFSRAAIDTKRYLGDYFNEFGLNPQIEIILWFLGWPFTDFLALFDPNISDTTNKDLINALPIIFSSSGISRGTLPGYPSHYAYDSSDLLPEANVVSRLLKPYEHILVVDMRKRKSQLVEEFKQYIENEYKIKSETAYPLFKSGKTYLLWEPVNERIREEAKIQLQIWKLRKEKYGYAEIGKKLSMDTDAARKAFYKAFERSQRKLFNIQVYQEKFKSIDIDTPTEACKVCPDIATCHSVDLCPNILRFLDQDETYSKEKWLDHDYKDEKHKSDKVQAAIINGEKVSLDELEKDDGGMFCPHCQQEDGLYHWIIKECDRCHYINPDYRKEY